MGIDFHGLNALQDEQNSEDGTILWGKLSNEESNIVEENARRCVTSHLLVVR